MPCHLLHSLHHVPIVRTIFIADICVIADEFVSLFFADYSRGGYLSPEIQIRNLKLFGTVTSEEGYRAEHDRFMVTKRKLLWPRGKAEYRPTDSRVAEKKNEVKDAMFNL